MYTLDLMKLVPRLGTPTDNFSLAVVALIVLTFLAGLIYVITRFSKAQGRVNFLLGILSEVNSDNLLAKRRDMVQKAQNKTQCGPIWGEFDETLVLSFDKQKLLNTFDAAHFFNAQTLAGGLTENRLIAAIPGILTAFGVIGTFVGLQLGLPDLSFENSQKTMEGVRGLISGASVAFMTSIWGILSSVLFNISEKSLEQVVRRNIKKLQDRVDHIFPRVSPEQALVDIAGYNKNSNDVLQGLAERVGNKLQEAMAEVTQSMQTSLEASLQKVLSPAISELVNSANEMAKRQSEGSEEALRGLVEKFTESIGQEGVNQREMMEQASGKITQASLSMGQQMSAFVEDLVQRSRLTEEADQRRANDMKKLQDQVLAAVQSSVGNQVEASQKVVEQSKEIGSNIIKTNETFLEMASEMEKIVESMRETSGHMDSLGRNLDQSIQVFSSSLTTTADLTSTLIQENKAIGTNINQVLAQIHSLKEDFSGLSSSLLESAGLANQSFLQLENHQSSYLEGLKKHVEELEKKVGDLLNEYARQVESQTSERLREWNSQTNEFCSAMTDATQSIANVVDQIEDYLQRPRR